ncbi:MAG: HEAT repeat domain-containing protein [Bacteroidales bacterium]|nr:HEAT repeat domain-containing protein [Bacteroidales bacterium]
MVLNLSRALKKNTDPAARMPGRSEEAVSLNDRAYLPVPLYSEETVLLPEMIKINPYFTHFLTSDGLTWLISQDNPIIHDHIAGLTDWSVKYHTSSSLKKIKRARMQTDIRSYINYLRKVEFSGSDNLVEVAGSPDKESVIAALVSVSRSGDRKQIPLIIALFRDPHVEIAMAAIETAEILKAVEAAPILAEYLANPKLYSYAWSALVNTGEEVVVHLEKAFHRPEPTNTMLIRIIRAMTVIGGDRINRSLFRGMELHRREVFFEAAKALYINNFVVSAEEKPFLLKHIDELLETGAWNLVARQIIRNEGKHGGLLAAVEDEIRHTNELLFMLLGVTYRKSSIRQIRHSLENPGNHDTADAVKLLKLMVDKPLRDRLDCYVKTLTGSLRIGRLRNMFLLEMPAYHNLLKAIVTMDGMRLGNYIRICAIEELGRLRREEDEPTITAQLFHPLPVIRESARVVMKEKYGKRYKEIEERLHSELPLQEEILPGNKHSHIHPGSARMEDLRHWRLFERVDLNELLKLAWSLEPFKKEHMEDDRYVTLLRSNMSGNGSVYNSGLVIHPGYHQDLGDLIVRIASEEGASVYQAGIAGLKELLFDNSGLLNCFHDLFVGTRLKDLKSSLKKD